MLEERIDLEFDFAAVGAADLLFRQIDRDRGILAAHGVIQKLVDFTLRQRDRKKAVLEAVVIKNIGEARRYEARDSKIRQGPRRMLTRGAATEIGACDEDFRLAVGRLIENERRDFLSVRRITQIVEQETPEARALD